jgi:succinate dehydrogenase/fumarate reductase cytochrome b subunit
MRLSKNKTFFFPDILNRASGAIIISIAAVTILFNLIEIGLFAASKLKPTLHLVSAVIKALIWLIYFIIIIVGSAASGSGSALAIILSLAAT